jgi:hypothetical protein
MKLFQDPLTWTNYKLPGIADVNLAALRRAQFIAQTVTAPAATANGPATTTAEAVETQRYSERYSIALDTAGKANMVRAKADARLAGREIESKLNGRKAFLVDEEYGRPTIFSSNDTLSNIQVQADQLQVGGALGLSLDGSPLGLPQTDRSIDIWDEGFPRPTHVDLQNPLAGVSRVFSLDASSVLSEHATQMAGVMAGIGLLDNGAGNLSIGAATNSKITSWNYLSNDRTQMAGRPLGAARVSSHSYGQTLGWYFQNISFGGPPVPVLAWIGDIGISTAEVVDYGRYSGISREYDGIAVGKPWTLQVRSAGNDRNPLESAAGWSAAGALTINFDGQTGLYFTLRNGVPGLYNGSRFYSFPLTVGSFVAATGTPPSDGASNFDTLPPSSTSKNMLTVGGVDGANNLANFSSYGATDDGRVKPEIVAPGVGIYTAGSASDTSSALSEGTSPAAALVSGTAGLITQRQEDLWTAKEPLASSSLKALLIHTAQELGFDGPNYDSGYGLIQAADAATAVESNYAALNVDAQGVVLKLRTFIKEVVIPESEWLLIDLGVNTATTSAEINWHANYASGYLIEGATSATPDTFVTLASGYGAVGGLETKTWASTSVRYVRLVSLTRVSASGISVNELTIKNGVSNLSLNKPVTASSQFASPQSPSKAVDGSTSTRWASIYAGVTEYPWLQIDLSAPTTMNKAVITWDIAYASEFYLEGAANFSGPYTAIGVTTASTGGTSTVNFTSVSTYRYIRMVALKLSGTGGVSVREFQVYNGATLLSSGKSAIANSRTSATFDAIKVTDGDLTTTRWESITPSNPGARFTLKSTGGPIRATAVWTDVPGNESPNLLDNAQSALINDIDSRIFKSAVSGVRLESKPWILNPASPTTAATRGDNFRDNVEQIETASAVANTTYTYELRSKMNRRVSGRQRVSIIFSGVQQIPITLFQVTNQNFVFDSANAQIFASLTWTSVPGQTYRCEWSTNLSTWTDIIGDVTSNSDVTTSTFVVTPIPPQAFFRIKTVSVNPFAIP